MKQLWFCPNVTNTSSGALKDLSHITCFNCDKKGHYATKCPEPRKTSDSFDDLYFDDWSFLLPRNAFLVFDTRFKFEKIEKKLRRS